MNVFDFFKDIIGPKKDLIRSSDNPEEIEKIYNPWVINKTFSYFADTIWYANEMNKYTPMLSNKMQYDYYLASINTGKRYSEQFRKTWSDDVKTVSQAYNCNYKKAEEILKILTPEHLELIKDSLRTGGNE
jgi:hypothetical protein